MYHHTLPAFAGRRIMLALAGLLLLVALAATSLVRPGTAAADTVPTTGYWQLKPAHVQNRCLDVANFSFAHAADVIQGKCSGARNQQWRFEPAGDDYYEVIARHSGKCLDVANRSRAHGADVIQGNCVGGTNQQWRFQQEKSDGSFRVKPRHSNNKCLDVANQSLKHAANVIQGTCWNPGYNQRWFLVPEGTK